MSTLIATGIVHIRIRKLPRYYHYCDNLAIINRDMIIPISLSPNIYMYIPCILHVHVCAYTVMSIDHFVL